MTETVWGSLKGSGNTAQNIIINTHTDGPNATEENGGLGLVALARHLASLPSRNHDMYFALVTGRFQLPQFTQTIPNPKNAEIGNDATSVWMLDHPNIYQAATLGVTVKHLGATMWTNDPATGQYVPTGGFEWGTTYTMQRDITSPANAEQTAYLAAVTAVNGRAGRTIPWPACGPPPPPALPWRGRAALRGRAPHGLAVSPSHLPAAGECAAAATARPRQARREPHVRRDSRLGPDHRGSRRSTGIRPMTHRVFRRAALAAAAALTTVCLAVPADASFVGAGLIDPISNLAGQPVYVYHGALDPVVNDLVSDSGVDFYQHFGASVETRH